MFLPIFIVGEPLIVYFPKILGFVFKLFFVFRQNINPLILIRIFDININNDPPMLNKLIFKQSFNNLFTTKVSYKLYSQKSKKTSTLSKDSKLFIINFKSQFHHLISSNLIISFSLNLYFMIFAGTPATIE